MSSITKQTCEYLLTVNGGQMDMVKAEMEIILTPMGMLLVSLN